ncbi:putative membrane protein [Peptoniphilus sp. ING2-D1G]|nr:putative membrane protein [Peptoniphilus sp. ING2-D1G]
MKDLKKFLYMHYISSKTTLYVTTVLFLILYFFQFINSKFRFEGNQELFLLLYHAFLIAAIFYVRPIDADKNLLLSLPLTNFKIYPWSVLLSEFLVLGFYLILFIPFYLLTGTPPGEFLLMQINFILISSFVKVLVKSYTKFERIILSLYYVYIIAGFIMGSSFADIPGDTDNFIRYNLIGILISSILFLISSLHFSKNFLKEKFKKKDKEIKKIKDMRSSKFGVYQRLKLWTFNGFKISKFAIILILLLIAKDVLKNKISVGVAIFNFLPFIMVLLLVYPPENILVAFPYNIYKIYVKDRIFKLLTVLFFNGLYIAIAYFLKIKDVNILPALFLANIFIFSAANLFPENASWIVLFLLLMYFRDLTNLFLKLNSAGYVGIVLLCLLMQFGGSYLSFGFLKDRYATGEFKLWEKIFHF